MFNIGLVLCRKSKFPHFIGQCSFRAVTHVIFDLDGTILDSETLYELMYNKILRKYGKEFNKEVRTAITGTNEQYASRKVVEMLELPITPEQYWKEIEELGRIHLTNPGVKPGAERLIMHLSEKKVPLAIATSGSLKGFKLKSRGRPDLFAHFHHIVHGSSDPEVINGKPAPDIFLVAARRFPVPADPKKCLVFEDAPNGLRGAVDAGMQVVMVPEYDWAKEDVQDAALILKSLEEFVPEQFGLPGYPTNSPENLLKTNAAKPSDKVVH
ncbi:unnamed protein product [Nezara viridula]|uniref:Uncharacterized protein n=1 Tax=Nezara viridula TaxID=85310 RepID=A0A9P0MYD1_NEZVI|nr:unnamed protein product [Nezara viridula]